jgi:hypothetical protein
VVGAWATPAKFQGYAEPRPERVRADVEVIWKETP